MPVMGVSRFERFFRVAAGLDVDRNDVKRYGEFVERVIYDLLIVAQAHAKQNDRDIIEPGDLPITRGLRESIRAFGRLDEEVELEPILERMAARPQLDLVVSEETERRLPHVVGGVSVALAQTFTILDPKLKNPATGDWERAFRIFDLLL